MDKLILVTLSLLAIWFRWDMGLGETCRIVGAKIAENKARNLQDAITPPVRAAITLALWAFIVLLLLCLGYQYGPRLSLVGLGIFASTSILAGVFLMPKPESPHYLRVLHWSMINRHADYLKAGDVARAEAVKLFLDRIELEYREVLIR